MATKKRSLRQTLTRGISFRRPLLERALAQAALQQRSLSNYIATLIDRDAPQLKKAD